MNIEMIFPRSELDILSAGLGEVFIQRWDLYPRQLDDGSYICIRKPLQPSHLLHHLNGEITLGTYVLDQASMVKYIVLDGDDDNQKSGLTIMARRLDEQGMSSYLEDSRRGVHLWLFFSEPIPGEEARKFGHTLLNQFGLTKVELFPKQDKLVSGPGSLVRLPFGIHRKSGKRYGFLNFNHQPLACSFEAQMAMLQTPKTIPRNSIENILIGQSPMPQKPGSGGIEAPTAPLSKRIKESISVFDFVNQYVDLAPNGRGLCPFHDDHQESFSVDLEDNYWYCFAGCGGGSIIDFWMKWNKCDFISPLSDMSKLLL